MSSTSRVVSLRLPPMHPSQKLLVTDPARIVVAACGSKFGKTFSLASWIVQQAFAKPQSMNWWTAPTYRQSKIAFTLIGRLLPTSFYRKRSSAGEMIYELIKANGEVYSTIEFRSADNPDSLRGEGVHACVVDEAAQWRHDSYISVWTTLTRTLGKLRIASTPKGRNWFYDEWQKGWEDNKLTNPAYSSYRFPTSANPFVPREALVDLKKNMPADAYRQEILAEFLDGDSAAVFQGLRSASTAPWLVAPIPGRRYMMGVDWAKKEDWTVFAIVDSVTHEVVHLVRQQQLNWDVNIKSAMETAKRWNNAVIMMDSTGIGDVPFDQMKGIYPFVLGYSISTNTAKSALIQKLQFAIQQKTIALPAKSEHSVLPSILAKEFEQYSYTVTPTGKLAYSAPVGLHDDCVIAVALANWELGDGMLQTYTARSVRGI